MASPDNSLSGIWHPFTQMKLSDPPIAIASAKDTLLYGTDGKTYIDAISSWWVNLHGHSNATIAESIAQQAARLEHVIFAGFTHAPAEELAGNLLRLLPDLYSKVFYSDDGSTSVEVAIKMALQYWYNKGEHKRKKIIAFGNAYHGDTFGAMAVGGRSAFNAPFQSHLFEVEFIPVPTSDNESAVAKRMIELIHKDDVAAFIFEPLVQGSSGMLMHKPEHLDRLIKQAKESGILTIADEVMTGFGRTGKNFAIEHLINHPDIVCLSKGITGGFMPLGVTVCTQLIFDAFYSDDLSQAFFHGHSYTANPLACAAANASMRLLEGESCQRRIATISSRHIDFAAEIKSHPFVKEVRFCGTIVALELNTSENTSYFNKIKTEAYRFFLKNGVLLRPLGNVVYIMPPYCITDQELQKVYAVISDSLSYLQKS